MSRQGTQFRIWANKVLREYLLQGYTLNQKALKMKNEMLGSLQETGRITSKKDNLICKLGRKKGLELLAMTLGLVLQMQ